MKDVTIDGFLYKRKQLNETTEEGEADFETLHGRHQRRKDEGNLRLRSLRLPFRETENIIESPRFIKSLP